MSESPVFMGGAGRSGTTLFVDMLGLHPRWSPVYETDFVIELAGLLFGNHGLRFAEVSGKVLRYMDDWSGPLPVRPHNKRPYERYHHGPHYILFDRSFVMGRTAELLREVEKGRESEGFRDFLVALFNEHCRRDGKPRWINKTPAYIVHLPLLHSLFPSLRFIHCVRDGRDVALSIITRPFGPIDLRGAAVWWADRVAKGVRFGREYPDQYLEVRFEDLVRHPEDTLRRMLEWLGEDGNPEEILRHYGQEAVELDSSRLGVWQQRFSPEERQMFHEIAGGPLDYFGYGA